MSRKPAPPPANRKQLEMRGSYNFLNGQKVKAKPEDLAPNKELKQKDADLFSANSQWTDPAKKPNNRTGNDTAYTKKQEDLKSSWLDNTASQVKVSPKKSTEKLIASQADWKDSNNEKLNDRRKYLFHLFPAFYYFY